MRCSSASLTMSVFGDPIRGRGPDVYMYVHVHVWMCVSTKVAPRERSRFLSTVTKSERRRWRRGLRFVL